ncbi:Long-chain fatty acid transport protein [hydrothermal vent metagenome]|uniref:Long-chain fatty acid transport protein n=1 Tax=hydrothermal vent metagenome TaxID=652676 RepID=A0A3B0VZS0_9ZZZZ
MHHRKLTVAMLMALATPSVYAAGFALIEQSASGQGLSYAGAAANAEDASVMWFNPAGMTEIAGHQAILAGHLIVPKSEFSDDGSYNAAFGNAPISGNNDNGATNGFVPNLYWKGAYAGYDFGLGINVPFGQKIKYEDDWVGRYHAIETNLKTLNINPSMAKKINDKVSFGFGLNAQYVDLVLSSKVDNTLAGNPRAGDGDAEITADSWAYGYNVGLFYQPTPSTDLGLAYRSSITHFAKGKVDYTNVTNAGALTTLVDADAKATVNLPASLSFSVNQGLNDKLQILADATWTQWSDYKELVINFDSAQADTNTRQDFKDSWRLSLGGIYQLNETIKLRAGVAFDQTPVSNPENRSPRTPDVDRKWFSVGLGYKLSNALYLDLAYSHLAEDKEKVNYTTNDAQYLVGSYSNAVDIVSAQIVWKY